ncbi:MULTISPECIES: delta-class carbonic anhydrase [Pseudidiomarina]|uniref:Cadmium carbonic anhydrase-like repeat protein n=2 Tax=Pseudidiomarina TaxID=2800384 RepID=A0A368USP3_9GAMM|nr:MULTISPECIES: delta-class carbonic anhydrase [Pseudidiomarina]PWW07842.1 hypothetical protein DET45_1263 [Pseudidiomarina maritima]RBP90173.1 hypothetical protein DFO81_10836 [Pseudidiomarina tainanensis]RCW31713.1 hypothetical protein DFO79_10862 [Pseudidiomarina tainanensis]
MKHAKLAVVVSALFASAALAHDHGKQHVADSVIEQQRAELAKNTKGKGFGPQSPRDLEQLTGNNARVFSTAPSHTQMNLCNIHFHAGAEHRGGDFTTYAGNGDGAGYGTGYLYNGKLNSDVLKSTGHGICEGPKGGLKPGDTIEVHYVFTSAQVTPGPTLGACLADATMNPQLRVEGQVYVVVNDDYALDFNDLTEFGMKDGYYQPYNIPANTGTPITYEGSTTGPAYNTEGSPLQVSWSVRPKVAMVDIESVGEWCNDNPFNEKAAHGVRNLVVNPELISDIHQ